VDPFWSNLFRRRLHDDDPVLEMVRGVPIFQDLNTRELRQLKSILHRRQFSDGEVIVREGEKGSGMYVIVSGQVRITQRAEDGTPQALAELGPGDFFGEQALLDETPRTASVGSIERCELVGFFRPDLLTLIENNPRRGLHIILRLSQIISVRLRHTNRLLKEARVKLHRAEADRERSRTEVAAPDGAQPQEAQAS
jgi:CRP/FNR family transcriptional regulator, cyclic AMP receptor protein